MRGAAFVVMAGFVCGLLFASLLIECVTQAAV
jgi:tetrahydromethanopterin S-methyltransferase subunit F